MPEAAERKPYFKTVATNRRARHDYLVEETLEAGIALQGSEVKSLRMGRVEFADSYARIELGECWLFGLQIKTYEQTFVQVPDPVRKRRLLVSKRELLKLHRLSERGGTTLIPLEIYFKGSWAKVKLGLCVGKTQHDKRQVLRERIAKREVDRAMKGRKGKR